MSEQAKEHFMECTKERGGCGRTFPIPDPRGADKVDGICPCGKRWQWHRPGQARLRQLKRGLTRS